ncbi:hypothetical protein F383_35399 [Gossypium arboreum]|uniref:Uncharacterized protein n=1 Tax=Gossypium arboreum TaxID=29729 RepID=A0A0B0PXR7_GOSAR|nr:hypothetical protein F383_35399 [Gossypium arboreum]
MNKILHFINSHRLIPHIYIYMFLPRAHHISCHSHEFNVHTYAHLHILTYVCVLMQSF